MVAQDLSTMAPQAGTTTRTAAGGLASERRELAHLTWCSDNGALLLLDLEDGQYHAMDAQTSDRFLAFAAGADDPELNDALLVAGLLRTGAAAAHVVRPMTLPGGTAMAAKTIVAARRCLARRGFRAALGWAMSHSPRTQYADAVASFRRAEGMLPSRQGDIDCLPRALGMFAFLRHATLAPEFVIGVRRFPFTAHAWVELDSAPVLENDREKTRIASFREILRMR